RGRDHAPRAPLGELAEVDPGAALGPRLGDQGPGRALGRHAAAVGGDRGPQALAGRLETAQTDTDAPRGPAAQVAHEDVRAAVEVARDQVARVAGEGHEAAVGGDRRGEAVAVALAAGGAGADAHGRARA